jgi:pimeloyl-ACP methyl ester carboxylesterase
MKEEALLLGPHRSLAGVYTPAASGDARPGADLAVVLLNAGLIHHVGPHRLHVKLARALGARGIGALRVDASGIGDSSVRPDGLPAPELAPREPREIMDDLAGRGHRNFVLFGICSGARQAMQAAAGDPRVRGLVLVNPSANTEDPELASRAATQFYLKRSLWNPRAWLNLFTGRVNYRALFRTFAGMARRLARRGDHDKTALLDAARREFEPLLAQGARLLIVFSDRDAKFIKTLDGGIEALQGGGRVRVEVHPEADHLFTPLEQQELFVDEVCRWVESLARPAPDADSATSLRALSTDRSCVARD